MARKEIESKKQSKKDREAHAKKKKKVKNENEDAHGLLLQEQIVEENMSILSEAVDKRLAEALQQQEQAFQLQAQTLSQKQEALTVKLLEDGKNAITKKAKLEKKFSS